ncbi:ABC transporter B family member 11-like isoform X1 [Iris pallida]|uniref:ABC transporter B family member 11-like isoform X1 n=1 Tax=Iris pallida TaxID=29817 RepID=A0AAX6GRE3_IRIPA|nr:ABC transporter B family member 11-like isoform X1 [Iris pallida]
MQPDEVSTSETPGRSLGKQVSSRKTSIGGGGNGSPSTKLLGPSTEQVSPQGAITKTEPEEPPQRHRDVPLRRLAYLNKPELPIILLGTIAASACGVTVPICGILLSNAVDTYYGPTSVLKSNASFWSLMFVVIGLASTVFSPARAYFFAVAGSKLVRRVRVMSFDRVVHMEIGWFDNPENSSGAVGARLSGDAAAVRCLVGDALALAVQNAAGFVAGLAIAFSASWQLALTILAFVPVMILNAWIHMKLMSGLNANAKVIQEEATQVAADAVGSIRTVASFAAEEKMVELYEKKGEGHLAGVKRASTNGSSLGFAFLLLFGFNAICFFVGARLLEKGKATMSEVFRVYFAISMSAVGIISQSRSLAPDVTKAKSATASVFAIVDRKSMIDSSDDSGVILEVVKGAITFQHVSFSYPTRPDVQVLQDFCLALHSGKARSIETSRYIYIFTFYYCCTGRRERKWEIDSDISAAEILRSRFWSHPARRSRHSEAAGKMAEEADRPSQSGTSSIQWHRTSQHCLREGRKCYRGRGIGCCKGRRCAPVY